MGMEIVIKKSEGWLRDTMNLRHLIQGIDDGKYKWLYTNVRYNEEETWRLLNNNGIRLKECWRITEDEMFRKIRSWLFKDRPPPPKKDRIRKLK